MRACPKPLVLAAMLASLAMSPTISAQPALESAASRARVHDDAAALAQLATLGPTERASLRATYLEARLLERSGRLDEARAVFERLAIDSLPAPLRADARFRRARLLARTGRLEEARRQALALAADGGGFAIRARAIAAECALALGDAAAAATEFAAVIAAGDSSLDRTGLARSLARAQAATNRSDEAAATLRSAFLAAPAHPEADALLAELARLDPSRAERSFAERVAVAAEAVGARAYDRALAELDGARPANESERATLAHARGAALFAKRDYAAAIVAFDEAVRRGAATAIDDAYSAARAANRLGDDRDAKARFEAFLEAHPDDRRQDELRLTLATIALDRGDRSAMSRLARRSASSRTIRARAAFALALAELAAGDRSAARDSLGIACPVLRDDADQLACRYLGALAAAEASATITGLEALAREQTHAFYGLAARMRLASLGREFAPEPRPRVALPPAPAGLPEEVVFLAALGLLEDAAAALAAHEREPAFTSPEGRLGLVAAYAAFQDFGRSFRVSRQLSGGLPAGLADSAQHPEAHAETVTPLASALGVDRFYVYGTMRQESGFRADAVSRVGALGILQMMPATAARAARSAGAPEPDATALFDPGTSIRLAMVEMQELGARYGGCLPLVAAGYNAGTAKVDAWRRTRSRWPIDLFLQAIPFDETRGYVRRVVGHTARYHALDGRPGVGPELLRDCTPDPTGIR